MRQGLGKAAVPFGALITPLPDLTTHSLPLVQRSPTACSACGAYMNAHCKVIAAAVTQHASQHLHAIMYSIQVQVLMKENRWLCSFCQQQNAIDVGVQDLRV